MIARAFPEDALLDDCQVDTREPVPVQREIATYEMGMGRLKVLPKFTLSKESMFDVPFHKKSEKQRQSSHFSYIPASSLREEEPAARDCRMVWWASQSSPRTFQAC